MNLGMDPNGHPLMWPLFSIQRFLILIDIYLRILSQLKMLNEACNAILEADGSKTARGLVNLSPCKVQVPPMRNETLIFGLIEGTTMVKKPPIKASFVMGVPYMGVG